MKEFVIPVISAFVATFAFTIIYNIRGKNILIASLCGALSWGVYLICKQGADSLVLPYFAAGLATALYSEAAARVFKVPATVYLIPGIIPLVPGLTIFRTMSSCLSGDILAFAHGLVDTIKIGGAIVLGAMLIQSVFNFTSLEIFTKKTNNNKI